MNNIDFNHSLIKFSLNTALVGVAVYIGRSYLAINPTHAALFAGGTFLASALGKRLIKTVAGNDLSYFGSLSGKTINLIAIYALPIITAISLKVFSPIQAFATLGIVSVAANTYFTLTDRSIWTL